LQQCIEFVAVPRALHIGVEAWITSKRFVLQNFPGATLGADFYENDVDMVAASDMLTLQGRTIHGRVMRITEDDRTTPNDQLNLIYNVSSYDLPDVLPGITPAADWQMFE